MGATGWDLHWGHGPLLTHFYITSVQLSPVSSRFWILSSVSLPNIGDNQVTFALSLPLPLSLWRWWQESRSRPALHICKAPSHSTDCDSDHVVRSSWCFKLHHITTNKNTFLIIGPHISPEYKTFKYYCLLVSLIQIFNTSHLICTNLNHVFPISFTESTLLNSLFSTNLIGKNC